MGADTEHDQSLRRRCRYESVAATEDEERVLNSSTVDQEEISTKSRRRSGRCVVPCLVAVLFFALLTSVCWLRSTYKQPRHSQQNHHSIEESGGKPSDNFNSSIGDTDSKPQKEKTAKEEKRNGTTKPKFTREQNGTLSQEISKPCLKRCEAQNRVWDVCRTWKGCTGCSFCDSIKRCEDDCYTSKLRNDPSVCTSSNCSYCSFCFKPCPLTFRDVTRFVLPPSENYFYQWKHSGKPYGYFDSPLFVDLNGDGVLDLFNSMHIHNVQNKSGYKNIMELAESIPYDATSVDRKNADHFFRPVPHRIVIEDDASPNKPGDIDAHGRNMLDLDGDGILDIMIASGGGKGKEMTKSYAATRDNLLFWGEKSVDEVTGKPTTIFRGGRGAARNAGIEMPLGRNRANYMFDANGDGLIDIFCLMDRPISNRIIPGVLLINQGNRTWTKDSSMKEYTTSMILTDADGDGVANEIVLSRGFCYPQRSTHEIDPKHPELGPFTDEIREFCSTRPVGSLAVFKYSQSLQRMEEISTKFSNISPSDKQPSACPHGTWSGDNDCHARSMVSGDIDGDLVADLVILYQNRLDFFFSSDRSPGSLPTQASSSVEFPLECKRGSTVRLLDIDNDGKQELLVMCDRPAATFLLYTQGSDKADWRLDDDCNAFGALGDIMNGTLAAFAQRDLQDGCKLMHEVDYLTYACQITTGNRSDIPLEAAGLSIVDLNNDGFMDAVTSYKFGYNRYFYSTPSGSIKDNRFIVFRLIGASSKRGNAYGIGATIVLHGNRDGFSHSQLREISSYQHTTDKYGYNDNRVYFGLGTSIRPVLVSVIWSNGVKQNMTLSDWKFEVKARPILIVQKST